MSSCHGLPPRQLMHSGSTSGVEHVQSMRSPERAIILVTHYQRLLNYIVPDRVHVLSQGRIVLSGGPGLALELEQHGYGWVDAGKSSVGKEHTAGATS